MCDCGRIFSPYLTTICNELGEWVVHREWHIILWFSLSPTILFVSLSWLKTVPLASVPNPQKIIQGNLLINDAWWWNDDTEHFDDVFADDECAAKGTEGDQQTITALYIQTNQPTKPVTIYTNAQYTNQNCDNIHKCTTYQPNLWQYTQRYKLCDNTIHVLHSHQPPFHTLWYLCCTHFGIAVSWTQILVYSVEGCELRLFWHPFNPREHNVPTNYVIHTIKSSGAGTAAIFTLYQPRIQTP